MRTLPYGTWPSPLSAAHVAAGTSAPAHLVADGERLLWVETRPAEQGRQALVAWDPRDGKRDLTPPDVDVRTRVHEYGGAPFAARDGVVVASEFTSQRLHRVADGTVTAVTPETTPPAAVRYADGQLTRDGRHLVCVRETHGDDVRNEIAVVDLAAGSARTLVSGRDFVAAPRLSDHGRLAWLAWDHPWMPWDAAELHVAPFDGETLGASLHVAGGPGDAVVSPVWLADGRLAFASDRSGYWEVHVLDHSDDVTQITTVGADVGQPAWQFGTQTIVGLGDGRLACLVVEEARCSLRLVHADGSVEPVALPQVFVDRLRPYGDGVAFLAAEATGARSVTSWSPADGLVEVARYDLDDLRPEDRAEPRAVTVPTPDGGTTHAFLYSPRNADVTAPPDARPPLVVYTHGGPTGNVYPVLTPSIAYWTTRGFAVADVNYRGSTGYGRVYRDALRGQWGVLDVVDTIAVAEHLAGRDEVDGARMAIRGGSAGGYTTLAVLTTPGHPFACGTSFFGVADLELLAQHTHKFEARYLDQMVGPLPDATDVYRERSPLHRVERLSRPLLVLQGLEDEVVPVEQAEAIVTAAADHGIPHAYIAFEGEQHGFRRAESIVAWLESELAFYGQVMGFAPAGDLPPLDLGGGPA